VKAFGVLACLMPALVCAGQTANAPTYEIRGVVVDHLTNQTIKKALLRLTPVNGPGQLTYITAADGRFEFSNVPKGKYRLLAQRRGYYAHSFHENGQYSTAVVVGPGLDATNIVFPLQAPASIQGLVVDEDGAPVLMANVSLYREMVNEGEKRVVEIGGGYQTDSTGHFHIGRITSGTYYMAVQANNIQLEQANTYPVTFSGDITEGSAAQPVLVSEGQSTQIHISLHPAPNVHVPLGGPASKHGMPMPQLFVRGPGNTLVPAGSFVGSYDGRSEITGLPAGHYLARFFSKQGRVDGLPALQEVDVADGVPLSVPPPAAGASISGAVNFQGGPPQHDILLMFVADDGQARISVPVRPDGTLGAPASPIGPGSYRVVLASNDYYLRSIAVQGAQFAADRIEVTENCHVKLSLVADPATSTAQLDGFALRNNSPIAGAMVLLVPHDPNRGFLFRRDQTDSDGSFTLPAIQPGQYTLVAIDDEGRGLLYKDPAVIRPYLAAGQSIQIPRNSNAPVKISVQPRLP
jgi:hypothetical protein